MSKIPMYYFKYGTILSELVLDRNEAITSIKQLFGKNYKFVLVGKSKNSRFTSTRPLEADEFVVPEFEELWAVKKYRIKPLKWTVEQVENWARDELGLSESDIALIKLRNIDGLGLFHLSDASLFGAIEFSPEALQILILATPLLFFY